MGVVSLTLTYVGDATSGAGGNAIYQATDIDFDFQTATNSRDLYGILIVRNAYTPVSAEAFTFTLDGYQE